MDFGSFLRQRRQQVESSNFSGNTGNNSQDSWPMDRSFGPPDNSREELGTNDSVFFNFNDDSDTEANYNQPNPYDDSNYFDHGPPAGPYKKRDQNTIDRPFSSRGRGFRGRVRGSSMPNRGRGSSFKGFNRRHERNQSWENPAPEFDSVGQPNACFRNEDEYFQDIRGNAGHCGTGGGKKPFHQSQQGSKTFHLKDEVDPKGGDSQVVEKDQQTTRDLQQCNAETNVDHKKKEAKEIVKTDDEKRTLAGFDIFQMNINWAHFGITKVMLKEASAPGKLDISLKKNYDTSKLEFYCKLCDTQTVSAGNFHDHLVGKKHKTNADTEVNISNTDINSEVKNEEQEKCTYGGVIGMELKKTEGKKDVKEEGELDDAKGELDVAYEKQYYENFNIHEVNIDWESCEITESMLNEARFECKGIQFEERVFDIFQLQFYCKLCDVQTSSTTTFYGHLIGRKHTKRVKRDMTKEESKDSDKDPEAEDDPNSLSEHEKNILQAYDINEANLNWDHYDISKDMLLEASTEGIPGISQRRRKKKEVDLNKLEFYCKLCASQMVSAGNFHDHLIGKKHKTNYQEHLKFLSEDCKKETVIIKNEELGQKSIVEDLLTETPKIVVGLSYIIELHSIYQVWCLCSLCGCKFRARLALNHVCGFKHRVMYMRENHPDEYAIIKKKGENNSLFPDFLENLCQEKMKSDGAGKTIIKRYDITKEGDVELAKQNVPADDDPKHKEHYMKANAFIAWVNTECSVVKDAFKLKFKDRAVSPLLSYNRNLKKEVKGDNNKSTDVFSFGDSGPDNLHRHGHMPRLLPHLKRPPSPPHPPFPFHGRNPMPYHPLLHNDPPHHRMHQGIPFRAFLRDPYMDRDPYIGLNPMYRSHQPEHFINPPERPDIDPYLDPDPLKRVRKPEPYLDPNPLNRLRKSEPYIDPDPLKRVLPSQKAKVKPVVIDYGHGKEEKSAKKKAKEWEDDINDILDIDRKPKESDSLALLSSVYSSPKRELSPPEIKPSRQLPFSKSYLERAKDLKEREQSPHRKSRPKKRGSDSSYYPKKEYSRSPQRFSRSPEYKKSRKGYDRYGRKLDSPPSKSQKMKHSTRLSPSPPFTDSPPRVRNPVSSKHLYRSKSPKAFKRKDKSRSRSPFESPPISRLPHVPPPRSRSPLRASRRSGSPTGPPPRSKSPIGPPPRSLPPNSPPRTSGPLHRSIPPSSPPRASGSLPKSLLPSSPPRARNPAGHLPRSNPPRPILRSRSPTSSFPRSIPSEPPQRNRSVPNLSGSSNKAIKVSKEPSEILDDTVNSDDEAQAERIANMLLSMKSSIVGNEMDDPHTALQALLSSRELTEVLLYATSETSSSYRDKEAGKSDQQVSGSLRNRRETVPPKPACTREKIAFSFAGKSSAASARNVPQTFLEEESSSGDD